MHLLATKGRRRKQKTPLATTLLILFVMSLCLGSCTSLSLFIYEWLLTSKCFWILSFSAFSFGFGCFFVKHGLTFFACCYETYCTFSNWGSLLKRAYRKMKHSSVTYKYISLYFKTWRVSCDVFLWTPCISFSKTVPAFYGMAQLGIVTSYFMLTFFGCIHLLVLSKGNKYHCVSRSMEYPA